MLLLLQASNVSDALVRPLAAEAAAQYSADGAEQCYDEDGNPEPVPQRVPTLPGPPVHPVQVRRTRIQRTISTADLVTSRHLGNSSALSVFINSCVSCLQALRCVEVMSLLMQQHLRSLVEAGLHAYLQMWEDYAVEPGSLMAYAGESLLWRVAKLCRPRNCGRSLYLTDR